MPSPDGTVTQQFIILLDAAKQASRDARRAIKLLADYYDGLSPAEQAAVAASLPDFGRGTAASAVLLGKLRTIRSSTESELGVGASDP